MQLGRSAAAAGVVRSALILVPLFLTGCGSGASSATTTSPVTATVAGSATSAPPDTTVQPGEPWIVYQRFTNDGGFLLDLRLVRPDGSGDHPLLAERPGNQTHPDWSPDGSRIVYTVDETQLWIVNADGSEPTKLPIDCSAPCVLIDEAAWSPDGRQIVFMRQDEPPDALAFNLVQAIDLADNTVRTVYTPPSLQGTNHPRWAPDGKSIVLELSSFDSAEAPGPSGSAVAIVDTTQPAAAAVLLTDWALFAAYPDWSWATDTIVFSTYDLGRRDAGDFTDPSPPSDLYTVKPDGTGLTQLTHNPSGTTLIRNRTASGPLSAQPTWSPDGTSIIFVQVDGNTWPGWATAVMDADGSGLRTAVGTDFVVGTHPRLRPVP
jgi:Tol biopolymer transport system component